MRKEYSYKEIMKLLKENFTQLKYSRDTSLIYRENNWQKIEVIGSPYQIHLNSERYMFDPVERMGWVSYSFDFYSSRALEPYIHGGLKNLCSLLSIKSTNGSINKDHIPTSVMQYAKVSIEHLLDADDVNPKFKQELLFNLDIFR